ncbi:MAG: inositol monophosphatase family protein [Anaerolineae bacterium]
MSKVNTLEACELARELAREAGALIREAFGSISHVDYKGEVNPVTEADTAAETLIIERLRQAFPDHGILGEESGGDHRQAAAASDPRPIWLIDPLDGTNNFAHGFPHFSVSVGLRVDSKMQLGVVYDPMRDELFVAQRGNGATLNGAPIQVTSTQLLADGFLATGFPYDRRIAAENNVQMLDNFLRRSQGVRRVGSAALDMAYVACGRFDGFWEFRLSPWDVAAATLLVEEAGGRTSDFSGGQDRLYSGDEVLASNGLIHDEMLRVLREGPAAPHPDYPSPA